MVNKIIPPQTTTKSADNLTLSTDEVLAYPIEKIVKNAHAKNDVSINSATFSIKKTAKFHLKESKVNALFAVCPLSAAWRTTMQMYLFYLILQKKTARQQKVRQSLLNKCSTSENYSHSNSKSSSSITFWSQPVK